MIENLFDLYQTSVNFMTNNYSIYLGYGVTANINFFSLAITSIILVLIGKFLGKIINASGMSKYNGFDSPSHTKIKNKR